MDQAAISKELREVELDLMSFKKARDVIQNRILEMEGDPRHEVFVNWAVTQIVMNGLIVAIVRCEGLIEDYNNALEKYDVPDNVLKLERKPK